MKKLKTHYSLILIILFICVFSSCAPPKNPVKEPAKPSIRESKAEDQNLENQETWNYIESGDYEKALNASDEAIKSDNKNIDAYKSKIYTLVRMGRKDEALKIMKDLKGTFKDAKNPEMLLAMGNIMVETGEYNQAVGNFKELINTKPGDEIIINAYKGLGKAFLGMQKYQEAVDAFTKAIETSDMQANEELYLGRSAAYMGMEKEEKSLDDVKKAIKIAPGKGYIYLSLANRYESLDRGKEAIEALEKARKIDPDFKQNNLSYTGPPRKSLYYNIKASVQLEMGEYGESAKNYAEAVKADTTLIQRERDLQLDMGLANYMDGNKKEAVNYVDKWLAKNYPVKTSEDSKKMAIADLVKGKNEEALENINKAIKENSNESRYFLTRGIIYQTMGDKEKAVKNFKEALSKTKDSTVKTRAEKHLNTIK